LGRDRPGALGAMALADASIENAKKVGDLGNCADCRTRVAGRRLLLDTDGRRKSADVIEVGLGKLAEKLPGIARQRLNITPLTFGIERIEGQRTLARTAHSREYDQGVAGEFEIDVAKVVFARAADDNLTFHEPAQPSGDRIDECKLV